MYGLIKISGAYFNQHLPTLINFIKETKNCNLIFMVGGGNIVRGRDFATEQRLFQDRMGILSTLINGVNLASIMNDIDLQTHIVSPICNEDIINSYDPYKIKQIMKTKSQEKIIICGGLGWCGNVSTDTAMVIRGIELSCSWVCKASAVGGVFDDDPAQNTNAKIINNMNYHDALKYKAYDKSAVAIAEENHMPLIVSSLQNMIEWVHNNTIPKNINGTIVNK